ncbi:MAG: hypothetical protein ABIG08_03630, partial [bacterium]
MEENHNDNYISLQKATKYCKYSQEYLSLRARQGKLKAVKFGRNWVTKKEWLDEYFQKVEEYNNNNNFRTKKPVVQKFAAPAFVKTTAGKPPKNLPIEKTPLFRFGLVPAPILILVVGVLLIAGVVSGKTQFQNAYQSLNPFVEKLGQAGDLAVKEIWEEIKEVYGELPPFVYNLGQNFDRGAAELSSKFKVESEKLMEDLSVYTYIVSAVGEAGDVIVEGSIGSFSQSFNTVSNDLKTIGFQTATAGKDVFEKGAGQLAEAGDLVKEYSQWLVRSCFGIKDFVGQELSKFIRQSFPLVQEIKNIPQEISWSYSALNNFIVEKLGRFAGVFQTVPENLADGYKIAYNFAEENLNAAEGKLKEISLNFGGYSYFANNFVKENLRVLEKNIKETGQSFVNVSKDLKSFANKAQDYSQQLLQNYFEVNNFVKENLKQAEEKIKTVPLVFTDSYNTASIFFEEGIGKMAKETKKKMVGGYNIANNFVEEKLNQGYQIVAKPFTKAYKSIAFPWRASQKSIENESQSENQAEEIENLRRQLAEIQQGEGVIIKEIIKEVQVEKITQITPVKEITQEKVITKTETNTGDLNTIRADITDLQTEVAKRLYAPGGVITQQIYVTQPVSSPKIYQENGDIVLQTAGSGNVIISAATGMHIAGKQVVIDSTDSSNPLVYIADNTQIGGQADIGGAANIGGLITAPRITLNAPADYTGNILDIQLAGASLFSINQAGNLSTGSWQGTAIATQYGGTGQDFSAIATGSIMYFSDTGVLSALSPGTSGQYLKTQGTTQAPVWAAVSGGGTNWMVSDSLMYSSTTVSIVEIGTTSQPAILDIYAS